MTAADLRIIVEILARVLGAAARPEYKLRGWDVKGFL